MSVEPELSALGASSDRPAAAAALPAPGAMHPGLQVHAGPDKGSEFVLPPGKTSIGRGVDNDIILRDASISRRHLEVTRQGLSLRFRDLRTSNGSYLNGQLTDGAALRHGDVLRLGQTQLLVQLSAVAAPVVAGAPASAVAQHAAAMAAAKPALFDEVTQVDALGQQRAARRRARAIHAAGMATLWTQWCLLSWPLRWLTLGLFVGFMTAASAGLNYRLLRTDRGVFVVQVPALRDGMARGIVAFEAGRWRAAQRAFQQVLQREPEQYEARAYLDRIGQARTDERSLQTARLALERGDAALALRLSTTVTVHSPLAAVARSLAEQARDKMAEVWVAKARAARDGRNRKLALQRLEMALRLQPSHAEALQLAATLRGGDKLLARLAEEAEAKHASDVEMSLPGGAGGAAPSSVDSDLSRLATELATSGSHQDASLALTRALFAYRGSHFREASRLVQRAAALAPRDERRQLVQIADGIDRFASMIRHIRRGGSRRSVRVDQVRQAVRLDVQLSGGYHRRELLTTFGMHEVDAALRAWADNDAAEACGRLQKALAVGFKDARGRQLHQDCERHATRLLERAHTVAADDTEQALALYRDVRQMTPPGSALHRQAQQATSALEQRLMGAAPPSQREWLRLPGPTTAPAGDAGHTSPP
ncbi:MAG: FHA domain-containing protein [Polyangiales bacterium]